MKKAFLSLFENRKGEIESLNGIRALSVFIVILFHFYDVLKRFPIRPRSSQEIDLIFTNLRFGVDLFFILSGFLISAGIRQEFNKYKNFSFKNFYIRRALRIFPAYYFYLIITSLYLIKSVYFSSLIGPELISKQNELSRILFDYLYLSNYISGALPHSWSLAVEEQFYILFPLLSYFILFRTNKKIRIAVLAGLYLLPLFFRIYHHKVCGPDINFSCIYYPFHTRFDSIVIGIIIMELRYEWEIEKSRFLNSITLSFLLLFSITMLGYAHLIDTAKQPFMGDVLRYNLMNLGYGLLLFLSVQKTFFLKEIFSVKFLRPVARVSYGMYLWQIAAFTPGAILTIPKGIQTLSWTNVFIAYGGGLAGTFLTAVILYCLIEYPFLRIKRRFNETQIAKM